MKMLKKDKLVAYICDTRAEMGKKAACDIHDTILRLLDTKSEINMIFAAAPSQNETLAALCAYEDIDWTRINAFHMDEYIGLAEDAPQRFGNYLAEHIFALKPFRSVSYINGLANIEMECERYTKLLREHPIDIVCLGIGENGHIAFNDPDVADFHDEAMIKPVSLDEICRQQQVNDGCFATLNDVPKQALTLTIPTLFDATYLFCSVPAKTKAWAVRETMTTDKIDEHCPATIMRLHENAVLYLDADSAADLL